jgi:copper chaperone CopZ
MLFTACLMAALHAEPPKKGVTVQLIGLFEPDRERDLKDLFAAKIPHLTLVSVDFATAQATVAFDPLKTWPGQKAEKLPELLSNELGGASRGTFGAKAVGTTPSDTLKAVEIAVAGCECKGCSYAAYRMVVNLPGVVRATASFKAGKVTAVIDPSRCDRTKLEEALKKGGVEVLPAK